MAEKVNEQINELARSIFRKKEAGANPYAIPEFAQLYHILSKWSKINGRKINVHNDEDTCCYAFHDSIMNSFKTYDGVRDFLPLYKTIFQRKLQDMALQEKNKKDKDNISIDSVNFDGDGNSQGSLENIINDKKQDDFAPIEMGDAISNAFILTAALCVEKMNKNKYFPLFFTDRLVYAVFDIGERFDKTVKRHSNKFDEAVVNEFMNSLLTGECNSVTEIKKFECRALSEFTEKQHDQDKSCCDIVPNYDVFNCFLKKHNKGITQSAFNQQRDKYFKMLKPIKEKLGLA